MSEKNVYEAIKALRRDALERGMQELTLAYGWSAIRLGEQVLNRKMTETELYDIAAEKTRKR